MGLKGKICMKKREKPEIMITEDGSRTLYFPSLDESYHSFHGALAETMHIFINAGLRFVASQTSSITLFEMGFGTGLNALMTFMETRSLGIAQVHYVSVEAYPVERAVCRALDYPSLMTAQDAGAVFEKMHALPWGTPAPVSPHFMLHKIEASMEAVELEKEHFDLVYYDAFAPNLQPELWSEALFRRVYGAMRPGAVLVTYSAKGAVKRALRGAGFSLESLPGPKGKREITRASRPFNAIN